MTGTRDEMAKPQPLDEDEAEGIVGGGGDDEDDDDTSQPQDICGVVGCGCISPPCTCSGHAHVVTTNPLNLG